MSPGSSSGPIKVQWWHSPALLILGFTLPFFLLVAAITPSVIRNAPVLASREMYLTLFRVIQAISLLLVFAASAAYASRKTFTGKVQLYDGCMDFLFYLTFAAYVIWFGPLVLSDPRLVLETLTGTVGAVYDVRDEAQNISGVTTATQFGISYAIIYAIKRFQDREAVPRKYTVMLFIIGGLALFRATVYSERIAVAEIFLAAFVVFASSYQSAKRYIAFGVKYFPFLLYAAAPIFFAVFEYPRSWLNHYIDIYDNFWHFVMDRFSLYYVTSLNNICALLDYSQNPTYHGDWTLNWLYRFPIIGSLLPGGGGDGGADGHLWFLKFLAAYASPEFNNTTGVLTVVYVWGWTLGLVLMGIYGIWAGLTFASFRSGNGALRYVYPIFLYSILELLRIGYIYDGRAVAAIIGIIIAIAFWKKAVAETPPATVALRG
jgi:hypothetical protein